MAGLAGAIGQLAAWQLAAQSTPERDPTPTSIEEFKQSAERILRETGVPGAGISLLRSDGVEWEGGIGLADRERGIPVTADTHFRAGSISKTFVAMALVQLSEDGTLDLDATVNEVAPEAPIDNVWHETDPVRVIHVLQHTAGFDDMHFNAIYMPQPRRMELVDVLALNRPSLRVRWKPGTRMSYSNPGYAVAAYVLEQVSGQRYSDVIRSEIFLPLEMTTSSFELTSADLPLLATGYTGPERSAAGYPTLYLEPAGNLHTSTHEMGQFVRMLLNWGELGSAFVIDPEYLSNLENPRTTLAWQAGLRNGYGSGVFSILTLPYRMLGHDGSVAGFLAGYAYSPSRDVGYVILLNMDGVAASQALNRLSSLAVRYLKRDIEPPAKPEIRLETSHAGQFVGYYHEANPRNQLFWGMQWLLSGRSIVHDGDAVYSQPLIGPRVRLIPVSETLFRTEGELEASHVFTTDADGTMVLAGMQTYAERVPRWRVEVIRIPLAIAVGIVFSVLFVAMIWIARLRLAQPRGFWGLKLALMLCPLALITPIAGLVMTPFEQWGTQNAGTIAVFAGTLALPVLAALVVILAIAAARERASRWLIAYAASMALAVTGISLYLRASDLLGIRLWMY